MQRAARRVLLLFGTATTAGVIDYAYTLRLLVLQERRRNGFNRGLICDRGAVKLWQMIDQDQSMAWCNEARLKSNSDLGASTTVQ